MFPIPLSVGFAVVDALKNNRTVQIVVGILSLALLLMTVKWLFFSSNLESAVAAMVETPPEPQTITLPDGNVAVELPRTGFEMTWPAVLDTVLSVLASVGAFMLTRVLPQLIAGIGSLISGAIQSTKPADGEKTVVANSTNTLALELARAVATNSPDLVRLQWQIRKPYALNDLVAAYSAGDMQAVKRLNDELEAGSKHE